MNQDDRLIYMIDFLLKESSRYRKIEIPKTINERKQLLRSLMNIRQPNPISKEFLDIQDEYLRLESIEKGIVSLEKLQEALEGIYLWRGDITRLEVDAIVNAETLHF